MKTTFNHSVTQSIVLLACSFTVASVSRSLSQQLEQVSEPARGGTFWLQSFQQSPPFPFDPYGGALPIYQLNGAPGQYVIGDSPENYQQLTAANASSRSMQMNSMESSGPPIPGEGGYGEGGDEGGATFGPTLFTNAPVTLLFDTLGSSSNGVLPSWRDTRPDPVPDGFALGLLIETNCPFELTRIEAEVLFDDTNSLPDTEFEVAFFRGANKFQYALYLDPEFIASDVDETMSMTLTNIGDDHWLLTLDSPTYAWGTNRIVTVRTVPNSDGAMAHMSVVTCSDTVPGITAYSSDNSNNIVQVALPKMRVWRRALSERRSPAYEPLLPDLELTLLPGYQLGSSTNLLEPFAWQTDELHVWQTTVDTREGMGFFIMRPDPTQ